MKIRKPLLRFREFTEDWCEKNLGECFYEINIKGGEGLELLSVTINKGVIKRSDIKWKDISRNDKSNYKVVKKGDMVYNTLRMWQGSSGVSLYDGIVSPAYTVLGYRDFINPYFFSYVFKLSYIINKFRKYSQGLTSDTWKLKYSLFKNIHVMVPCIKEQERIVKFFSNIENIIINQELKIKDLEIYRRSVLEKVFNQEIRFKNKSGESYYFWEENSLNKVSRNINDGIHKTPIYCNESNYRFINGNNLKDLKINLEGSKFINEGEFLKYRIDLDEDSLLISINGSIGNLAYYNNELVVLGKSIAYINLNREFVDKRFICYLFQTKKMQILLHKELTGSTIKNLSLESIRNLTFNLPSLEEQIKIINFLYNLDLIIYNEKGILSDYKLLKKGLLQKMFI